MSCGYHYFWKHPNGIELFFFVADVCHVGTFGKFWKFVYFDDVRHNWHPYNPWSRNADPDFFGWQGGKSMVGDGYPWDVRFDFVRKLGVLVLFKNILMLKPLVFWRLCVRYSYHLMTCIFGSLRLFLFESIEIDNTTVWLIALLEETMHGSPPKYPRHSLNWEAIGGGWDGWSRNVILWWSLFENMNDNWWTDIWFCLLCHSVYGRSPHLHYEIEWSKWVFIWNDLWSVVISMAFLTRGYCIEDQALLFKLISVTYFFSRCVFAWKEKIWISRW